MRKGGALVNVAAASTRQTLATKVQRMFTKPLVSWKMATAQNKAGSFGKFFCASGVVGERGEAGVGCTTPTRSGGERLGQ